MKNLSTLLIITYQIIVDISGVHQFRGGQGYPALFRAFVYVLQVLTGLDIFEMLHLDCIIRDSDYTFKLFTTTLAPLAVLVLALLWELAYKAWKGDRQLINGPSLTYTMIALYFVLPATSQIITKSFFCQAFDDGTGNLQSFMKTDMVLSCDDKRYEFISMFCMIMVVVCKLFRATFRTLLRPPPPCL